MKKMQCRKVFGGLMAGVLLAMSLAACGSPDDGGTPSSAGNSESGGSRSESGGSQAEGAAMEPGPLGKYGEEITLTTVRTLDSTVKFEPGNPDRASLEENIWQRSYKEELGINLEYLWTPNTEQYEQKWNAAMATQDLPDFAVVGSAIYKELVEADLVMDMTDIFDQYASDLYRQYVEAEDGLAVNFMTFGGRMYGLPHTGTTADNITVMFIRRDWLEKVERDVPKTMEELRDTVKAFQDARLGGEDTVGISLSNTLLAGIHTTNGLFEGYGAYYDTWVEDGSGGLAYGTIRPEMREALLGLQQMYKDGMFRQDFATIDGTKAGEDVASGKCGIVFGTFWAPLNSVNDSIMADEKADWIVCDIPTVDGSPYKSVATGSPAQYIFVNKNCEHPEAVVKLLNLNCEIKASGDRKHEVDEDGFEAFKYKVACDMSEAYYNLKSYYVVKEALDSGDTSKIPSDMQSCYDDVVKGLEGDRSMLGYALVFGPGGTYEKVGELRDAGRIVQSAYTTFQTDTMLEKSADLNQNLAAAIQKVILGADISVFDEAVETWKSTGGDTITQEVNDWYKAQ